jgi:hypothetical protein
VRSQDTVSGAIIMRERNLRSDFCIMSMCLVTRAGMWSTDCASALN